MNIKKRIFLPMTALSAGSGIAILLACVFLYRMDVSNKPLFFVVSGIAITLIVFLICYAVSKLISRNVIQQLEHTQLLFESTPLSCILWDNDRNVIDCNDGAVKILNLSTKQELKEKIGEFMPPLQPCGTSTAELLDINFKKASETGRSTFEFWHILKNGEMLPLSATIVRTDNSGIGAYFASYSRDLREDKKMAQNLEKAQKHKNIMLDLTPLACALWDDDVNMLSCNKTYMKLFGMKTKQELKDRLNELFPEVQPDGVPTRERMNKSIKEALHSETGECELDFMHILPNGEELPVNITIVRVDDGSGAHYATYLRDMREYKRMAGDISRRDRLIRAVNQAAGILLSIEKSETEFENNLYKGMELMANAVNADRAYIWKNQRRNGELYTSQLYEWLADGSTEQSKEYTVNVSYRENVPDWFEVFSKGECINDITRNMLPSTQEILSKSNILSTFAAPIFLEDEFWGFVGFEDCHYERVMSENEAAILRSGCLLIGNSFLRHDTTRDLRLQTVTLTTLFDSIPSHIFVKDLDSRYTQCNQFLLNHFGVEKENIIGKDDVEGLGLPPEIAKEFKEWDRKIIDEQVTLTFIEHVPGIDGKNPLCETVKAPLVLNGEVVGILGISHDITKHKEMEEKALEASRSKSAFLANMSHEIRTPMNSIIGFSELALDDKLPLRTKDYLIKITQNSEWLLQIINDILDISKIESGKFELENIPFDLCELFKSCRTLVLPKAEEKGLVMHFYAEPSVGKKICGDPTRLRQILVNLLTNAVKFTNSGMVKALAVITKATKDKAVMRFEIKDSGIGMTTEQIETICDPFTQADSSVTRKFGGTGLGLAISKNFVELMGGTLNIESTVGLGSKFNFELEFDLIDDEKANLMPKQTVFDESEKPSFSGEVLVCEDNALNQQVIREHLLRVGLTVVVANNGKEGIDIIKDRLDRPFDIIFMDMHMPVMDGLEASTRIIEMGIKTPIVALTANVMSDALLLYESSGISDTVGKPFTAKELWKCLIKYFINHNHNLISEPQQSRPPEKSEGPQIEEIQRIFVRDNQNTFENIEKALKSDDIKTAYRLVHSLKSNAGFIKEKRLQEVTAKLEALITQELPQGDLINGYMEFVKSELDTILKKLEHLQPKPAPAEIDPADKERVLELFSKLEPLLKNKHTDSLNYVDELRGISGLNELVDLVEHCRFNQASDVLEKVKGEFTK
jgi:PAS domain S-box-containing protein